MNGTFFTPREEKILISYLVFALIVAMAIGFLVGTFVGKKSTIKNAQIVEVTDTEVYIDFGHTRLDDGHYTDSEIHIYNFEEAK